MSPHFFFFFHDRLLVSLTELVAITCMFISLNLGGKKVSNPFEWPDNIAYCISLNLNAEWRKKTLTGWKTNLQKYEINCRANQIIKGTKRRPRVIFKRADCRNKWHNATNLQTTSCCRLETKAEIYSSLLGLYYKGKHMVQMKCISNRLNRREQIDKRLSSNGKRDRNIKRSPSSPTFFFLLSLRCSR